MYNNENENENENVVLCASNSYEKKYYFNPDFDKLPEDIKNELKIMCVLFTEEVGGILDLEFDDDGTLLLNLQQMRETFYMMR